MDRRTTGGGRRTKVVTNIYVPTIFGPPTLSLEAPTPTRISDAINNSNTTNGEINAGCESSVNRGDFNYRSHTDENNYSQNENETYTVPDPELTNNVTPYTLPWPNIVPRNSIPEQGRYNLKLRGIRGSTLPPPLS